MASYFLDDKPNQKGVRMVRSAFCPHLPDYYSRIFLGDFDRIEDAVQKAEEFHARTNGCAGCKITSSVKGAHATVGLVG